MHDPGLVAESKRTAIYARLATRVADGETLPPVADLELQFSDQDPCGRILQELRLTAIARLLPKNVVETFIEQMRASVKPNFFPGGIGIQAVNHGIVSDCAFGKDGRIELEIRQNDDGTLPSSNPAQSSDAADKKETVVISSAAEGVPVSAQTARELKALHDNPPELLIDTKPGPGLVAVPIGNCVFCNKPGGGFRTVGGQISIARWCSSCWQRAFGSKVNPAPADSGEPLTADRHYNPAAYYSSMTTAAPTADDVLTEAKVKTWAREVLSEWEAKLRPVEFNFCPSCGAAEGAAHKPICPQQRMRNR